MTKYENAYTEVYEIIKQLDEEEYTQIPSEVIKAIEENRNTEYRFELDEDIKLKDQELLSETKAILFNLFRDYLSTPEQKEKIIKMQAEERRKNEQKKAEQYNLDIFANKSKNRDIKEEHIELIEYKENILKRIFNKIRQFFHVWKRAQIKEFIKALFGYLYFITWNEKFNLLLYEIN